MNLKFKNYKKIEKKSNKKNSFIFLFLLGNSSFYLLNKAAFDVQHFK